MKKTPISSKKLPSEIMTPDISKKPPSIKTISKEEEYKEISQELNSINNEDPSLMVPSTGESVLVAVRIRPMNNNEISRGDDWCLKVLNDREMQIYQKGSQKLYQFNSVLADNTKQDEVFMKCAISVRFIRLYE